MVTDAHLPPPSEFRELAFLFIRFFFLFLVCAQIRSHTASCTLTRRLYEYHARLAHLPDMRPPTAVFGKTSQTVSFVSRNERGDDDVERTTTARGIEDRMTDRVVRGGSGTPQSTAHRADYRDLYGLCRCALKRDIHCRFRSAPFRGNNNQETML